MTHSLSFRTWMQRTASMCVAMLMVASALVIGWTGSGRSGIAPAGAATIAAANAAKSHCPSGSAPGITSGQVTLAASIVDISSGSLSNATVGVPSTQAQEADYNLVAKKINSEGGAGCRKIVMKFYDVNPVDAANAQQACLTIAAAQPYIVLDSGSLTEVGASTCIPQHHILLASSYLTPDDLTTDHPVRSRYCRKCTAGNPHRDSGSAPTRILQCSQGVQEAWRPVSYVRCRNPEH